MRVSSSAVILSTVLISTIGNAADIKQSTFTQVVNDVQVLDVATKKTKKANPKDIFKLPDMIRTGANSRAELIAEDNTVTRIGANSIFSFDPANRTINLEKGSLLFQAPKGKGGGNIRTSSAAAAVLGTTMIVSATDDGGFKVLLLEGSGKITLPNGKSVTLKPGQMVFVLPNGGGFSPIVTFKLEDQVEGSLLVNGFDNQLPSRDLINLEITKQNELLANGEAVDTGLLVLDLASNQGVQVVDPHVLQQYFENAQAQPNDQEEPPAPPFFDVIIRNDLDDQNIIDNEGSLSISGNNVLIDSATVDTLAAGGAEELTIEAANVMQFADNPDHFMEFLADVETGPLYYEQSLAEVIGPLDLTFVANEFRFPNEFRFEFNGRSLTFHGLTDLNLSSSGGEVGLRIENSASGYAPRGGQSTAAYYGPGSLTLSAERNINLNGNVRLYSYYLNMEAGNNIKMNGGYLGFTYGSLEAGNTVNLKGVGFGGYNQYMSMSAKTIILENIDFSGTGQVYLRSQNGMLAPNPNTGQSAKVGYVNFIRNVTYGGSPAQNAVGEGIYISSLSSSNLNKKASSKLAGKH